MANHEERALHDVRRKVSEVFKKEGDKISVGYTSPKIKRNEGDVWEDADGKQWTVKEGLIQSISKMDQFRTPVFCPECKKSMGHWLDTKYWRVRGKCTDCTLTEETKLRLEGKWTQYEADSELRNQIAFLKDKIAELEGFYDSLSIPEIIHADGENILMVEKWNIDLEVVRRDLQEEIDYTKLVLKNTEEEYQNVKLSE